jgi:hypothetical protein
MRRKVFKKDLKYLNRQEKQGNKITAGILQEGDLTAPKMALDVCDSHDAFGA